MSPMKREANKSGGELIGTLSVSDVARRWHSSRKKVRRLLAQQVLPFIQIRGRLRIPVKNVEQYECRFRDHPR